VDAMNAIASLILLGFVLGVRHATDSDHVVAIATIVSRTKSISRAARVGIAWGIGHSATILLVGGAITAFKWAVPERLSLAFESLVGAMLVILGLLNVFGARLIPAEKELYDRASNKFVPAPESRAVTLVRPLIVGLVHGLAGSAAAALLILSVIPNARFALAYLGVFGFGTIIGMMLITTAMAVPVGKVSPRAFASIRFAAAVSSIAFGVFIVMHNGLKILGV
jgi:hypothetical protein